MELHAEGAFAKLDGACKPRAVGGLGDGVRTCRRNEGMREVEVLARRYAVEERAGEGELAPCLWGGEREGELAPGLWGGAGEGAVLKQSSLRCGTARGARRPRAEASGEFVN